eukprot:TRINITY_DN14951_c0_g1_i1.p2 TRINITY_DN14951_c0_g1~~TRINITY_DN14951_c0_g1_i1.p2  ORF type:complete len:129 (+),score=20.20 TRINITY_DN14951_c0_g1_i1:53-388(+)
MLGVFTGLVRGAAFRRANRGLMTGKQGPRGFMKGKGCKPMGRHTTKGHFILEKRRLPVYDVPDTTDFKLNAYVSHSTKKTSEAPPNMNRLVHIMKAQPGYPYAEEVVKAVE